MQKSDYTDVSDVGIDDDKRERLYTAQTECVVNWTTRDGWPVGVMHRYVWHDDRFWITCTAERKRVPALRARPQSSVIVSSEGTWLGGDIATTAKTLATVHDDAETKAWFYPVLAERMRAGDAAGHAEFIRRIDTPQPGGDRARAPAVDHLRRHPARGGPARRAASRPPAQAQPQPHRAPRGLGDGVPVAARVAQAPARGPAGSARARLLSR